MEGGIHLQRISYLSPAAYASEGVREISASPPRGGGPIVVVLVPSEVLGVGIVPVRGTVRLPGLRRGTPPHSRRIARGRLFVPRTEVCRRLQIRHTIKADVGLELGNGFIARLAVVPSPRVREEER